MSFAQRLSRVMSAFGVAFLIAALIGATLPVNRAFAQDDVPVLILPVDKAQFLPGAKFDFRVEAHVAELPGDFKVTVNGEDASVVFSAEPTTETWTFGSAETPSTSLIWRNLTAPAPGEYKVEVTAGGKVTSATWTVRQPVAGNAKNVILFIGDGLTVSAVTAARVMSRGIKEGRYNDFFAFDKFEEIGLASTSSVDSLMADSANTASSINTGHIGSVNATGSYSDTSPDLLDDPRVETFAQMIRRTRGMAVGVVTTSDISDATPAAVWAHGRNRSDGNRAAYITQLLDEGLKPEVLLGGGARRFIPQSTEGSRRADDRDLFKEFTDAGYTVVTNKTELMAAADATQLLGIFHPSDLNVWLDRNVYTDNLGDFTDQPGLVDMTMAAINVLSKNPNGFYLEVEAASIDKQMHPMDTDRALADLIELERSVAAAVEWARANAPDTLILVTADHGHGFDVYGTVDVEKFNAATDAVGKRAAIGVYNNGKYPTYVDENGDFFPDNWAPSRVMAATVNNHPDYTEDFQVSPKPRVPASCSNVEGKGVVCVDNPEDDPNGIPMNGNLDVASGSGVHTLQDVPVYATGPGAAFFGRVYHQSEIFFGMAAAIGLDLTAADGKAVAANTNPEVTAVAGFAFPTEVTGVIFLVIGLGLGLIINRRKATA